MVLEDRPYLSDDVLDATLRLQQNKQFHTVETSDMRGLDNLKDKVRECDEPFCSRSLRTATSVERQERGLRSTSQVDLEKSNIV